MSQTSTKNLKEELRLLTFGSWEVDSVSLSVFGVEFIGFWQFGQCSQWMKELFVFLRCAISKNEVIHKNNTKFLVGNLSSVSPFGSFKMFFFQRLVKKEFNLTLGQYKFFTFQFHSWKLVFIKKMKFNSKQKLYLLWKHYITALCVDIKTFEKCLFEIITHVKEESPSTPTTSTTSSVLIRSFMILMLMMMMMMMMSRCPNYESMTKATTTSKQNFKTS
jgi:hypothetical protein